MCGGLGLNHRQPVIRQLQLYSVDKKRLIMGKGEGVKIQVKREMRHLWAANLGRVKDLYSS